MNDREIIEFVKPFTMVSEERLQNVLQSVQNAINNNIAGDFVEIGVWKGGIIMAMALKCKQMGVTRKIHAYDTFQGMTSPSFVDVDLNGNDAQSILPQVMCYSSFQETKGNIDKVDYPHIEYHMGDILKTNLALIPPAIAVLRLDTDWYDLTKFEIEHFEPNVSLSGIIIIDDYGHWQGCKKAVDEFISTKPHLLLQHIDYTGVYWVKS